MQVSDGLVSKRKVGSELEDSLETQATVSKWVHSVAVANPEVLRTTALKRRFVSASTCRSKHHTVKVTVFMPE